MGLLQFFQTPSSLQSRDEEIPTHHNVTTNSEMNTNIQKVPAFFTLILMAIVRAEVSKTGSASPSSECNGSLFLNSRHGSPAVFLTGQFSIEEIKNLHKKKLLVDVEVHGCGCFHVYSKRNG